MTAGTPRTENSSQGNDMCGPSVVDLTTLTAATINEIMSNRTPNDRRSSQRFRFRSARTA